MDVTVTGIERKARGVVAVTVSDGGDRLHLLPLEALILHRIHSGATFPREEWERIRSDAAVLLATRTGLELLSRKQRTEQELREAFAGDFLPADIDGALARLHELGYLDDSAWAARYVATARAGGRGEAALRRELRSHGISDDDIVDALDGRDDVDAALETARKRARSLRSLDEERQQRRLYDFLRRRGFGDAVARHASDAALAEARAGSSGLEAASPAV